MKTLLFALLLTLGGHHATGTMPAPDEVEESHYVIIDAPSILTAPAPAAEVDSLWEWPRQLCGLLSEAPPGMTWFLLILIAAHWLAITFLIASRVRWLAHHDGRAEAEKAIRTSTDHA